MGKGNKLEEEKDASSSASVSSSDSASSSGDDDKDQKRRREHKKHHRKHKEDRKKKKKSKKKKRRRDDDSDVDDAEDRGSTRKRRKHEDDRSVSSSSDYSRDDSSSSDDDRRSKKKKRRHEDRKRKKDKKKKKSKSRSSEDKDDGAPSFGKYGILKPSDYQRKQRSFTIWLEEVKGIMSFNGPKWELQNYFKEYAEDFNTATLPHVKYYDYDKWEMEEYQKNKSESAAASNKSSAQRDEVLHAQRLQEQATRKRQEEMELVRNMMSKEKRDEMKRKAELQAEMAHAFKRGDQETYLRLKSRLEPEK